MEKDLESKVADFGLELKELLSSLTILKSALENENETLATNDVDNFLEIIIEKFQKSIAKYEEIQEDLTSEEE